ncbi:hypothetical protein [Nocardia brasiliensis]
MNSTATIRAVLAALLGAEADSDFRGWADSSVEHAQLIGLLYRVVGKELRETVVGAPLGECRRQWSAAIAPDASAASWCELTNQLQFEAYWLREHISTLASHRRAAPVPALLGATVIAVDAVVTMLALIRYPHGRGSDSAWRSAREDLATALRLVDGHI